ncbi:hypothetical protein SGRA_4112 [Saprospira grandis str. Lewin]|uniref:Uncharacterized protein n=2 Tax=Saprospira TaxID=1007 RepID=H6L7F5_SAPGL|nr:hypothetical protein SGRA_4112 [Saprospira grandis str. Lewin]
MHKEGTLTYKTIVNTKADAHVYGYYAQEGYILADDGSKVKVKLVTDGNVYNAVITYTGAVKNQRPVISKESITVDKNNPRPKNSAPTPMLKQKVP